MNILITGGASGLGKSITQTLASSFPEAKVFFTYNSSADAAGTITKMFSNTEAMQLNFTEEQTVNDLAEKIAELDINILIHNALTGLNLNHFHKTDSNVFLTGFKENILPVLKLTRAFIKAARIRKSGRIITVLSSYIGGMPQTGLSGYIAEKNYMLSMAKSWASENVQFNIQSNCISPEFMDTPLNRDTNAGVKEEMIKSHPLKKLLTAEEVADTVAFLVKAPAHINGQNIFLNTAKN